MDQPQPPDPIVAARALAVEIAAAAEAIEAARRLPEPLLTHLHDARLFRILLPRSLGGDQVAPGTFFEALGELARHDASVAWNVFVANVAALITPYMDPEGAKTIFDDPRALLAWGAVVPATATVAAGGYRASGRWDFVSGCRHATWMGAHCQITETDGTTRKNKTGDPITLTLLFPAERATLLDNWNTIGLRGTGSESFTVSDVLVPEALVGQRADPTVRREKGPLYAFTQQSLYAVGVAGVAVGIARAMFEALVRLTVAKVPMGRPRMAEDSLVQAGVARAEAKLGAARAYVLATLAEIYAAADDWAPIDVPDRARVRLAATHAIHAAIEVADYVYKAAGVDAIVPGGPIERRFRDMHTLSQQIQARDGHYETIGKVLLGVPPAIFY